MTANQIQANDWYQVPDFVARHPNLFANEQALRYQLRARETNGLAKAVVRLGKRLLVNETKFLQWLESQTGGAA